MDQNRPDNSTRKLHEPEPESCVASTHLPIELTAAAFIAPQRLSWPYAWIEHIPFASWLVEQHKPATLVELGTHTGNSYLAFCQAVARGELRTRCFAVDTWKGDEHSGFYGEDVFQILSDYHDRNYGAFSRLVRSTFDDALAHFADYSVDLLHIDGLHTYEAVAHDFHSWRNKLSARGIILLHDTNVREHGFGVFRLWQEVRRQYPNFEFLHGHGLGVLGVGTHLVPQIENLFSASRDEFACHQVRNIFARLGQALTTQEALLERTKEHQQDIARWKELEGHYDALAERASGLERELSDERTRHQDSVARWKELEGHYDALAERASGLERELSDERTRHQDSVARWKELEGHYDALAERASGLERELSEERERNQLVLTGERERLRRTENELNAIRMSASWLITIPLRKAGTRLPSVQHTMRRALKLVSRVISGAKYGKLDATIRSSGLFDQAWYVSNNPGLLGATIDPIFHYLRHGAAEGRDPNPLFDTDWYMAHNPDVAAAGHNPLAHYLAYGAAEGRDPHPLFDTDWYVAHNPDVAAAGHNPLAHYLNYGAREGRATCGSTGQIAVSYFELSARHSLGHLVAAKGTLERHWLGVDSKVTSLETLLPCREQPTSSVHPRSIDVIVPVYGGVEETHRCIESVLGTRLENRSLARLILIDDCSPSAQLRAYLDEIATRDGVLLVRNPVNKGFVASVNHGMSVADKNDVILLNSDTEVTGNWVDRLAAQANADPRIATVTPFSNNATISSFPDFSGRHDLLPGLELWQIDEAFKRANVLRAVDLPTGVGFCMYIKRACLDEIGDFDEQTFGAGYGEENDFCLRAGARGWRHILAGDVFVFHVGETSFRESAVAKKARAFELICERYPGYSASVAQWCKRDPALPLRFAASAELWRSGGRHVVLHVLHTRGGGTERHVAELTSKLWTAAHHMVLLAKSDGVCTNMLLLLQEPPNWRAFDMSADALEELAPLLRSFGVSQVHVHHFIDIFDQLQTFLRSLGLPYDVTIHDYASICPRINLVNQVGRYCGEPDEKGCLQCLAGGGVKLANDIVWWRERGRVLIAEADRVLCPSVDVGERLRRYVPDAHLIVVPHEEDFYNPDRIARIPALLPNEPLRVAVLGDLYGHKGGAFLLDCIEAATQTGAAITWHVIGHFEPLLQARVERVRGLLHVTGQYKSKDLPRLIADVAPHIIFMPQRWPETYSYTLSEALVTGCAVLAPDIGVFRERTAGVSWCWLYPVNIAPRGLVETLLEIHRTQIANNHPPPLIRPSTNGSISPRLHFYHDGYLR